MRTPKPIHPDYCWHLITKEYSPLINWLRKNYPPTIVRKVLHYRILKQDHEVGIEDHYVISNEFFCQFLDKKYAAFEMYRRGTEKKRKQRENTNLAESMPGANI